MHSMEARCPVLGYSPRGISSHNTPLSFLHEKISELSSHR